METTYDVVIIGSGPAGLGAAFELLSRKPSWRVLMLDKNEFSSGGLRNDCKMNFSWPIGFPEDCWDKETAGAYLARVERFLEPNILEKRKKAARQTDLFHLEQDALMEELRTLDVLSITPMDALNTLFRLREKARRL